MLAVLRSENVLVKWSVRGALIGWFAGCLAAAVMLYTGALG
jgi:hypothetical protein